MNKTEFRILWSEYEGARFESVSIDNKTEIRDEGIKKWFVLTHERNDDCGVNMLQRTVTADGSGVTVITTGALPHGQYVVTLATDLPASAKHLVKVI